MRFRLRPRHLLLALAWAAATPLPAAQAATPTWQVALVQLDANGAVLGKPQPFPCPQDGCQTPVNFSLGDKTRAFMATITFVTSGAYLVLQALSPDLGKVIDFDKGFQGPIFIPLSFPARDGATLNFILTGPAVPSGSDAQPSLMENSQSLVFQRKMAPDLTIKLTFTPPPH